MTALRNFSIIWFSPKIKNFFQKALLNNRSLKKKSKIKIRKSLKRKSNLGFYTYSHFDFQLHVQIISRYLQQFTLTFLMTLILKIKPDQWLLLRNCQLTKTPTVIIILHQLCTKLLLIT